MAGTIEFIQGAIKHGKKEWEHTFPAIEDIMVVHNTAMMELCPMYMQQYLDKDKTAFYLLAKCNPLKGDCSRQMACRWLEDLFYNKCGCPSSYDIEAGGTMSRKVAISKELLPADNDAEYMDYYQEQMAKMKEMFAAEQAAAKKQKTMDNLGFDPDDGMTIDVTPAGEESKALPGAGTTAVDQSAGTAVGMPKPIFYGAVFHANGFGMKLGYDKKVWTLSKGDTTIDQLGFGDPNAQLTEQEGDNMEKLTEKDMEDMIDQANNECEKCGDPACKDGEICGLKENMKRILKEAYVSPEDSEDIADMFASFSSGSLSERPRSQLMGFMQMHADELKKIARQASQSKGFGDFGAAQDLGSDDLNEAETEDEINEILGEDGESDVEKQIDEYAQIEDESEEDDEILSESMIRHSTMLAREIW